VTWTWLVLPSLALNYLGQAMVLAHPETTENPFFMMAPDVLQAPLVILATMATIVASQAVITGAFSLTQQAVQLGLLPRLQIVNTSARQHGQIYLPQINYLLLAGVVILVLAFKSSSALASAYWRVCHRRDDHIVCHRVHRGAARLEEAAVACSGHDDSLPDGGKRLPRIQPAQGSSGRLRPC